MLQMVSKEAEEVTINVEVDKMPPLPPLARQPFTTVLAPIFDIIWSACPLVDYPYLVKVPGSCCYQFYPAQAKEARYLK